jgi:uncharacterized membrane protein YtjA (UPF0391 family)
LASIAAPGKQNHAWLSRRHRYKASRLDGAADASDSSVLQEKAMLKWAIIFAIVSLITGWMGFGGLSGATATIAKVLFACFVILFLLALLTFIGILHLF